MYLRATLIHYPRTQALNIAALIFTISTISGPRFLPLPHLNLFYPPKTLPSPFIPYRNRAIYYQHPIDQLVHYREQEPSIVQQNRPCSI
jgi:hypothetical protein